MLRHADSSELLLSCFCFVNLLLHHDCEHIQGQALKDFPFKREGFFTFPSLSWSRYFLPPAKLVSKG
jgi:hypothetical protein